MSSQNILSRAIQELPNTNYGSLKKGDLVVYNWKAKISLGWIYYSHPRIKVVKEVNRHSEDWEYCVFESTGKKNEVLGCDVFWLRKCTLLDKIIHINFKQQIKQFLTNKTK